jgi:hypothetical protein
LQLFLPFPVLQTAETERLRQTNRLLQEAQPMPLPVDMAPTAAQLLAAQNDQNRFLLQAFKKKEEDLEHLTHAHASLQRELGVAVAQLVRKRSRRPLPLCLACP